MKLFSNFTSFYVFLKTSINDIYSLFKNIIPSLYSLIQVVIKKRYELFLKDLKYVENNILIGIFFVCASHFLNNL